MIITVTMNPAIDKTIETNKFLYGGLNRIPNPIVDAGGKGINVSKTIKAIGGNSLATGFLGKEGSSTILETLQKEGISHDFVMVDGITRTNMKIVEKDGTLTELNENGMTVPLEKITELLDKLQNYADKDVLFVLAGSIPKGVNSDIYARIIETVRPKGAKIFVDADGELFSSALNAVPDMIKPNHVELAEYFGVQEELAQERLIELGKILLEKGIENVVISRGSKGAIFLYAKSEEVICYNAVPVEVASTVGAGDAMTAALAYAYEEKMPWKDSISLAMAAAAAAVETKGTKAPQRTLVENMQKRLRESDMLGK